MELKDQFVLITGASSGLGAAMSQAIARSHGANLIIAARNIDKLNVLKAQIQKESNVVIDLLQKDLSRIDDTKETIEYCKQKSGFYGAILNAGVTYVGDHTDINEKDFFNIINLNIIATALQLTEFVKHFEHSNHRARLMVVSSMAASIPTPYQSLYSGSKAFLTNFTNALSHEIKNPQLSLSVFSPGGIKTEMTDIPEFSDLKNHLMDVDTVAHEGISCLINGKYNHIPGKLNQINMTLSRLINRKFVSKTLGKKYKQSIEKNT